MKLEDFAAPEGFRLLDDRRYGKARLAFLRLEATPGGVAP